MWGEGNAGNAGSGHSKSKGAKGRRTSLLIKGPSRGQPGWGEGGQADHAGLEAFALCKMRRWSGGWTQGHAPSPVNIVLVSEVTLAAGVGVACAGAKEGAESPVRTLMPS